MFTSVLSIGRAYRHITQRFISRTPRRYCHLITLVTSVYRKTNVFLTTVGTATPPGGKMGEWSPFNKTYGTKIAADFKLLFLIKQKITLRLGV